MATLGIGAIPTTSSYAALQGWLPALAGADAFIANNIFRLDINGPAFKYMGQKISSPHFHLGSGTKELMKHHLPHQWRGWYNNLLSILNRKKN